MTERAELHRRLAQVKHTDGEGLVTVAIPPDESVGEMRGRIQEDHAEAEYIDADGSTRPERAALDAVRSVLADYEETPDTGVVIYAGMIESESEPVEFVFDALPEAVPERVYEQGHEFVTDPLEEVVRPSATFGLVVVERGGAALGRMEGERITALGEFESGVMGKTRAGGQSAERFARRREEQTNDFFGKVAGEAERCFVEEGSVDGLLLGGTEVTVAQFRDGDYLDSRLDEAVVDSFSVEYASEQGLRELSRKAREAREEFERRPAEDTLEAFFEALATEDDPVAYGEPDVDEALEYDAVETLLLSTSLRAERVHTLRARAEDSGAETVLLPTELERGKRFDEAFGGIGALLRFPVE